MTVLIKNGTIVTAINSDVLTRTVNLTFVTTTPSTFNLMVSLTPTVTLNVSTSVPVNVCGVSQSTE